MFSGRDSEIDSKISIDIRDINKYYNFLMPEDLRNYGVLNCIMHPTVSQLPPVAESDSVASCLSPLSVEHVEPP
jgi:hypothetical protein